MSKDIAIKVAGAGEEAVIHDLTIQAGTTVGEVLRAVNLTGYVLSRGPDTPPLAEADNLYTKVEDGDKLIATTKAEAGGGTAPAPSISLLAKIRDFIPRAFSPYPPDPKRSEAAPGRQAMPKVMIRNIRYARKTGDRQKAVGTSSGRRRLVVPRSKLQYWREQGWVKNGNTWSGAFRMNGRSWRGHITEDYPGHRLYYINKPPAELQYHPKWPCFSHKGRGMYEIHFHIDPKDVDSGIMAVERILYEACQRG